MSASAQEPGEAYGIDALTAVGGYLNGALPEREARPDGAWAVTPAFPELDFTDPTDAKFVFEPVSLTHEPRGDRLFVGDKKGKVWSFTADPDTDQKTLFLDISDRIKITPNAGLGELAFHPDFGLPESPNRGYVYTHYFWSPVPAQLGNANQVPDSADELPNSGYWRLSRFTVPDGANSADAASELVLIQQYDAHHWHNGGSLFFDNDGFLYLSSGDIGGDQNVYDAGQTLQRGFFGGVLRIDIDKDPARSHPIRRQPTDHDVRNTKPAGWPASYSQEYFVPNDNPWLDESGAALEEFWSIGIRSPHRMSYDRETQVIWVGDVGQSRVEEVSRVIKGGNNQWPYLDGRLGGYRAKPAALVGEELAPAHTYAHSAFGAAVIGGPLYRGHRHRAALGGRVLFADHQSGEVSALIEGADGSVTVDKLLTVAGSGFHSGVSSFGTDRDGEVYLCRLRRNRFGAAEAGDILTLVRAGADGAEPPPLLSQTGAFTDLQPLTPSPWLISYQPAAPFWSDGAAKARWISLPNDGTADTAAEQIDFATTGNWAFPKGTVLVKHFEMPVDARTPGIVRKIETRFFVHGNDGIYFGFTYRWRADGSDADLVGPASQTVAFTTTDSEGIETTVDWQIPSRSDCLRCHTAAAGYVLGLRTHQLNSFHHYPATGRTANQLRTLHHLGLLAGAPADEAELLAMPASAAPDQVDAPLETKARSYIDTNCASCHRPGGVYANFDARFTTPLSQQNLINGPLVNDYGIDGQAVVRPREDYRSILLHRIASTGVDQMPPLGKSVADTAGVKLINDWINSLDPEAFEGNIYDAPGAWIRQNFGPDPDPALSAWTADPDNDTKANLQEFALGTHGLKIDGTPLQVRRSGVPAVDTIQLPQPLPSGVTIITESSSDARQWTIAEAAQLSDDRRSLEIPASATVILYRLKFTLD
ncbi:MAG: PQQ-dependent sugar dehydrogenase [Verrucomicrobiae bacterium]|nr:PQQ-dependent sugar dehydrogenase [Verrucomicrobiae bacterium]